MVWVFKYKLFFVVCSNNRMYNNSISCDFIYLSFVRYLFPLINTTTCDVTMTKILSHIFQQTQLAGAPRRPARIRASRKLCLGSRDVTRTGNGWFIFHSGVANTIRDIVSGSVRPLHFLTKNYSFIDYSQCNTINNA